MDSTLKCTNRWEYEFCVFFCCIIIVVKIFNKYDKKCSSLDWRLCKTYIVSFKVQKPTCRFVHYVCSVLDSVAFFHQTRSAYIIMTDCCSCAFVQHQQTVSASPATLLMYVNPWDVLVFCPQAEIVKRLNGICAQVLPYLSQEVRLCDLFMTLSIMTLSLISDINVLLGCFDTLKRVLVGFCLLCFILPADINVCVCFCV